MEDFNFYEFKEKMKSNEKIKVTINGMEVPYLSDYTYVEAKSFFTEPQRSANGVIENLNSYATFLTPRLKFSFKLMPIETYRFLMKMIKNFNEFIVQVYDIVEDTIVTKKMYFYPKEFPQIYQYNLETLAVLDESFELVGTNANLDTIDIIYNSNPPRDDFTTFTSGVQKYYSDEFIVGEYDTEFGDNPLSWTYNGYKLEKFNTQQDGNGTSYYGEQVINTLSIDKENLILYAIWQPNDKYKLSFDYGEMVVNESTTEISREITKGQAIGTLPTPTMKGYIFKGWFSLPSGKGTEITSATTYKYTFNKTIYAYWVGVDNTITFNANGGAGTMETLTVKTGNEVELPSATFTKEGQVFEKWSTNADGTGTTYNDGAKIKMPDGDLVLYAQYAQGYYLTYNTNGGINDGYKDFGKVIKIPMFTQKDGFYFAGWYENAEFTTGATFPITLNTDKTIYARWEKINE